MANLAEAERNAQDLQERLRAFGALRGGAQEQALPEVCNSLDRVDSSVLAFLVALPLQARLNDSIQYALNTGFRVGDQEVKPYKGGYTVVAINLQGEVRAAESNPTGEVYEHYGENLFPYALSKALQRLCLYNSLTDKRYGLEKPDNYEHIEELMGDKHVYLGEAVGGDGFGTKTETLMLGASGCELTDEYKALLAPDIFGQQTGEDQTVVSKVGRINFVAGYADMFFAKKAAHFMSPFAYKPSRTSLDVIQEPEFFSLLRRAH